ncbi:Dihydropteroate synthase [Gyrodon lividus]|nr:Dihydropteroate synthase [Gyrodon lividus]
MNRQTKDTIHINELLLTLTITDDHPAGREARLQPILLSLAISHDITRTACFDDLTYSINYASVCSTLAESLPKIHHVSLEALVDYLFDSLFCLHSEVQEASVIATQMKGPLQPATTSITATRRRDQTPTVPEEFILKGLKCPAIIGVESYERTRKQPLFFDITVRRLRKTSSQDPFPFLGLSAFLSHKFESSDFLTVEALIAAVAFRVLEYTRELDDEVTVRISKPMALPLADSAQVQITRRREDFPGIFALRELSKRPSGLAALINSITKVAVSSSDASQVHAAAIALGSNLGDRFANIETALRLLEAPKTLLDDLAEDAEASVVDTSFMYETAPMYVADQPRFANCACIIETNLTPMVLLRLLNKIETVVGRVPTIRNGPRAVDLDILTYDSHIIDTRPEDCRTTLDNLIGELVIPHPRMSEREFVLRPLNDMIPGFVHPVYQKNIRTLLNEVLSTKPNNDFPMLKVIPFPRYPSDEAGVTKTDILPVSPTAKYWTVVSTDPSGGPRPHKTHIMATLNVTPDSFSDGSLHNALPAAIAYTAASVASGADIIDIGGYSTRPGADFVSTQEETNRVVPVIKAIRSHADEDVRTTLISVDTFRWEVTEAAVRAGANCINDVYAFTGPEYPLVQQSAKHLLQMRKVARELGVPVVLMHSRGDAGSNKDYNDYPGGLMEGIKTELGEKVEAVVKGSGGIRRWLVVIDPGIGFSKPADAQFALLRNASSITADEPGNPLIGYPQLIGASKKSFLSAVLEQPDPEGTYKGRQTLAQERGWATAAVVACAVQQGASVVRVHDVLEMKDVVAVASAIWSR